MGPLSASPSIAPRLEIAATAESPGLGAASGAHPAPWRDAAGGVAARARTWGERHWLDLPDLVTFCFDERGDRVLAAPRPGMTEDAVADLYWHSALPLVIQARGGEALHASGVLMPRGVVALCGPSGSGKSTIAYGLHRRGYRLWADDVVALEIAGPAVAALPLPFDVRLRAGTAAAFGLGADAARLAGSRDGLEPEGRTPEALAAVCVLERASGDRPAAAVVPLRASAAYPALLASAYCFDPGDPARTRLMLDRYLSLVARVPIAALSVGAGLGDLPATLDAIERAFGEPRGDAR